MNASEPGDAIFTFDFLAVSLINLLVMAAYYLLFVISGPYAVAVFNASPGTSGLVAGVMVLGCLAGRFVCGRLIEVIGFKKVLYAGFFAYIAGIALYLAVSSLPLLLAIRLFSGIGIGCIGTVTGTLIARIVPSHKRGLGLSYFSLSTIIALAAGPFFGIFLMQRMTFSELFLLCLGLGALSLVLALFVRLPGAEAPETRRGHPALGDFIEFTVVPLCLTILLAGVCYGCIQAFIATHAAHAGLEGVASFYFLAYAAVVFLTRPLTGRLIDARGENPVAYPALILMALSLFLLARADSAWMLLLSGALLGAGYGNFQSVAQVTCIKLVPRHRFGQATSTFFIFLDLGVGLGPYALGQLVPSLGYNGLFMAAAAVACLAIPLYHTLHGRKEHTHAAPLTDKLAH